MGRRDESRPGWGGAGWREISSRYGTARHLNACIVYIWNFPFDVFGPWLTTGNELWKAKPWIREDCCTSIKRNARRL